MKSYDQMAKDVLARISAYETAAKQRRRTAVRAAVALGCACLTALVCLVIPYSTEPGIFSGSDTPPATSQPTPVYTSVMQAVYLADGTIRTDDLTAAQKIPMWYRLQVEDIRDTNDSATEEVNYEAEYEALMEESKMWIDRYTDEGAHASVTRFENVIISTYSAGHIQLSVPDPEQVYSIRAACETGYGKAEMSLYAESMAGESIAYLLEYKKDTAVELEHPVHENGWCWISGEAITLPGETYTAIRADAEEGKGDFYLRWKPDHALSEALNKYPDTPLSAFSDWMTVAVNYKDGTVETHTLEIRFEDNGTVLIDYLGAQRMEGQKNSAP